MSQFEVSNSNLPFNIKTPSFEFSHLKLKFLIQMARHQITNFRYLFDLHVLKCC